MAIITLEYDGRNRAIKQLIEVLLTLGAKEKKDSSTVNRQMVRESLNTAFEELHSGRAKKNARELFG